MSEALTMNQTEIAMVYAALTMFYSELRYFIDSEEFDSMPSELQEVSLVQEEQVSKFYEKITKYISVYLPDVSSLYNHITNITPKRGI